MYYLRKISPEAVEEALCNLERRTQQEREILSVLFILRRSKLIGRTFNKACLPIAQELLPGYTVRYGIREYGKRWRYLYFGKQGAAGCYGCWHSLDLVESDSPRLTKERIDALIEQSKKRIADNAHTADVLTSSVPAFNSAVAYVGPLLSKITHALNLAGVRNY